MLPDGPGASRRRRSAGRLAGLVLVALAVWLCVWEAGLGRDSGRAHWSVGLVVVAAFVAALVVGRGRQRLRSRAWVARSARALRSWRTQPRPAVIAVVGWTAVVAAVVGWDLVSFVAQSHTLPTLSYFIGRVTRYRPGRGGVFALWLATGAYLVAGWRAVAPRS